MYAGGVYKGWGQFNFFGATTARINGDNTQFDKNNKMANKWYRIVGDIDLENKTVTTTLYDRDWKTGDAGTYMLNSKAFTISAPDETGANPNYPRLMICQNSISIFIWIKELIQQIRLNITSIILK